MEPFFRGRPTPRRPFGRDAGQSRRDGVEQSVRTDISGFGKLVQFGERTQTVETVCHGQARFERMAQSAQVLIGQFQELIYGKLFRLV